MLSPKQLSELITLIQTTRIGGPAPVRRAQRIENPGEVSIALGSDEDAGPYGVVKLLDISPRGLCFMYPQDLRPGSSFVVRLEDRTGRAVSMVCAVVHSRRRRNDVFHIGAEFKSILGDTLIPFERAPEDLICIRGKVLN
ncbi:MAG TPA: PilZ domain-containing protein [Tepidisphaeraceae bacterium]|nr:PilZ domain-containing protein [Tepidisphaeraceae bacterium]